MANRAWKVEGWHTTKGRSFAYGDCLDAKKQRTSRYTVGERMEMIARPSQRSLKPIWCSQGMHCAINLETAIYHRPNYATRLNFVEVSHQLTVESQGKIAGRFRTVLWWVKLSEVRKYCRGPLVVTDERDLQEAVRKCKKHYGDYK